MIIPFNFPSHEARNKWLLHHFLKKHYISIGISEKHTENIIHITDTEKRIIKNSKNLFGSIN